MAPEICLAKEEASSYTNSVDIFALGCILYELWMGERAFPRQNSLLSYASDYCPMPQVPSDSSASPYSKSSRKLEDKNISTMWRAAQLLGSTDSSVNGLWVNSADRYVAQYQINRMISLALSKNSKERPSATQLEIFCAANVIRTKLEDDEVVSRSIQDLLHCRLF